MDESEDIKRKLSLMGDAWKTGDGFYFPASDLKGPEQFYNILNRLNPADREVIGDIPEAPENIYFILSDGHLSFLHLESAIRVRALGFNLDTRESFLERIRGLRPEPIKPIEHPVKYHATFKKIHDITGELLENEQIEEVIRAVLADLPKVYLVEMHDSIVPRKELTNEVGVWYQRIGEVHKDGFV